MIEGYDMTSQLPEYNKGRMFVSPIVGCMGACTYCYLQLKNFSAPKINNCSIETSIELMYETPNFISGKNGTIISVGAWGDIFPPQDVKKAKYSIMWIGKLLKLGNPVQIMSKNKLDPKYISEICNSITYKNQLLYSSTITSFKHWMEIEPGTDCPMDRLKTCLEFGRNGVATNVMIKPFLPGITDNETQLFVKSLIEYNITYCVAGILYWNDKILNKLQHNKILHNTIDLIMSSQGIKKLDCNSIELLSAFSTDLLDDFIKDMKEYQITVYKKSSCVNSNLLGRYNQSNYFKIDLDHYCVDCGNCRKVI